MPRMVPNDTTPVRDMALLASPARLWTSDIAEIKGGTQAACSGLNSRLECEMVQRILVCDDEELIRWSLCEHLTSEGYAVQTAEDGKQALESHASWSPDAVILDLKMPKVDGLDVLRTIKSDERLKLIPVVMLTSSREEHDLIKSYALGANAYVVKPVSFEVFVRALQETGSFWGYINEPPPAC